MATVKDILAGKSSVVHTVQASATVLEATQIMNERRIGSVVVMEGDSMAGMFSERDVLRRVVAEERLPSQVLIREVMTTDVICCPPNTDIDKVSRIMRDHRVRHIPVLDDDGRLLGLISIGDVNAYHASDQEATIHHLHDYIHGRI
jgi:CBS domain-containing protein